ncbi:MULTISPECIES: hypothetical protein [Parafrankia]|nr:MULTISPECIES: hypothetical protein [Parafrankia]
MIRRVSGENGVETRCTAASLARWLNGAAPQPAIIPVVVEAFARLLDNPALTPADLGWSSGSTTRDAQPEDPWRGDPVAWVTRLGRTDMLNRRAAVTAGLYSLAAATPLLPAARPAVRRGTLTHVSPADVARVRAMAAHFGEIDDLFGGGHARSAVAAYLVNDVAPLLQVASGPIRADLFTAAAEVTYLAGWMAADDLQPGLAQRYYIQAVRLAIEADDPLMRATALRSLASQAVELGHAAHGLALADAAADALHNTAPARTRAWVNGMRAEALAATGHDPRRVIRLLASTETDLEHADSPPASDLSGNYRREGFEHQVGLTLLNMGDLRGAEEHLAASTAARRPGERRTRALIGTRLATVQIRQHRSDAAAATLLGLADDLTAVKSARLRRTCGQIRGAWQTSRVDPTVAQADRLLLSAQATVQT